MRKGTFVLQHVDQGDDFVLVEVHFREGLAVELGAWELAVLIREELLTLGEAGVRLHFIFLTEKKRYIFIN